MNIHDVLMFCLEMTLLVFVCFVEFYVFDFGDIDMALPKIVYKQI